MIKIVTCVLAALLVCSLSEAEPQEFPPIPILADIAKNFKIGAKVNVGSAKLNAGLGLGADGPRADVGAGFGGSDVAVGFVPGLVIKNILEALARG